MYKSPIDALIAQYINDVETAEENAVMSAVLKCGINVDKDELVKALAYDRGQYEKGYADAKAELIRCKDCKWYVPDEYEADYGDCINKMGMCNSFKYGNDYCSEAERKPPQVNPEMVNAFSVSMPFRNFQK